MNEDKLYTALGKAIAEAPSIPPCMTSDPDAWFPNMNTGRSKEIVNVKMLCAQCPVRKQCLAYAMANPDLQGIWGGLGPQERWRLRASRKAQGQSHQDR
jgi:WhiB family redox-sensing transcriptional regulator